MKLCRVHLKPAVDQRNHRDGKCAACVRPVLEAEKQKRLKPWED